jgi:glycine cleavage system transcriptional repressor
MATFAITSIGADRPGIVAAVTRVLLEQGCNLEDTAMSILRGQFAMVMVVAAPEGIDAIALEQAVVSETSALDLVTTVRAIEDHGHDETAAGEMCTVVVYGPDHPGIVHHVASQLASLGVNIVDVTTRVSGHDDVLYSMVMEVVLPAALTAASVESTLTRAAADQGLTVRVTPADADVL